MPSLTPGIAFRLVEMFFPQPAEGMEARSCFAVGINKPAIRKEMGFGVGVMSPMNRLNAWFAYRQATKGFNPGVLHFRRKAGFPASCSGSNFRIAGGVVGARRRVAEAGS